MSTTVSTSPRWDLSNVYPGLESPQLATDIDAVNAQADSLLAAIAALPTDPDKADISALAVQVADVIERLNHALEKGGTINAYIYSFVSTDSYNQTAKRLESQFEQIQVKARKALTNLSLWLGRAGEVLPDLIQAHPTNLAHAYFLTEANKQSKYLMSPELEDLASDLSLSGANAWSKLQGTVTSQLSVDFELDGQVQTLPMPALINLRSHPDAEVRRRGYEAEMKAWESVAPTLAAAMNGVKGSAATLNKRRGREDALHAAIDAAHIDRETLDAMIGAMKASLPVFWKYFQAKARRLGKDRLAWWDIFAPVGKAESSYTFEQAREFVETNFGKFSPGLQAFAKRAFDNHWIDAEQRKGKRGGAFCMGVPGVKESRILSNFDGSLDQVSTLAHELGHGFHNECAYQAGRTELQQDTPMTLAETASIMCETIVTNAAIAQAAGPEEELAILETSLTGDAQVIVDIYSRFLFEREVFERREQAELSHEELSEIMERAQKEAYGEGLDERYLHKYMWTWKPHYYFSEISFYNFPYAFGLLFGTGLYAIYQQRGADFVPDYQALLASTGEASAAELAARFGIDIRSQAFWESSLAVIGKRIERYIAL